MSESRHVPMWQELGLDVDKHNILMDVLGGAYQALFMSRTNRPKSMEYFDFVMSEVHGERIQELQRHRKDGGIVIGSFCTFVPEELVLAVGGISVGLCAGAEFGFAAAEQYLPRNTCSLIKAFFGFQLEKVCPYMAASDVIVGENTCDGKKKAYEQFDALVGHKLWVMDIPQVKNERGKALMKAEYLRFAEMLEKKSGRKITVSSLLQGIEIVNAKRAAMDRLRRLRMANPAPLAGLDALLISQIAFNDDPIRFTASVHALCNELETRIAEKQGVAPANTPRLVISGCPSAIPNWKLHSLIEGAGAVIVGDESCVGERGLRNEVKAQGETFDSLIDDIVDRYFQIDCAIFSPNPDRAQHALELAKAAGAQGVIHFALQFCTPYQAEAFTLEGELEKAGMPVLKIETDYSQEDVEQLRTRIEAFLEKIGE